MRVYRGKISFLLSDDTPTWSPKDKSIKVNQVNTDQEDTTATSTDAATSSQDTSQHSFKYLPPIDQPLTGSNWLSIEENFVLLIVTYKPLIAPDFMATPDSRLADGHMHLIFIKEGITRPQLLALFQKTENGTHLASPLVEYVRLKAFRLEPKPFDVNTERAHSNYHSEGIMMIDGERVPYGPVQGELVPSIASVLVNMNKWDLTISIFNLFIIYIFLLLSFPINKSFN